MTRGERLCSYRKKLGLSQEALAQQLGVSRQSVSKWERDESLPEADKLPALARIFHVTVDHLLAEDETPSPSAPVLPPAPSFGWAGRLFRRWGWVGGLVLAGYGLLVVGMGLLAQFMARQILPLDLFPESASPFSPFFLITWMMLGAGAAMVLGGTAAAVALYRKRR